MLSDLVQAQIDTQGIKPIEVVRRARHSGKRLSVSTIQKILSNLGGDMLVQTADALAVGLRVPLLQVVLAALGREQESPPILLLERLTQSYAQLRGEPKEQVDYLLSVLIREIESKLDELDTLEEESQDESRAASVGT